MRTTIDIHEPLLERAKELARQKRIRLADVVNDALTVMFDASRGIDQIVEPYKAITYGSGGTQPGVDVSDNAALRDLMDEELRLPDGSFDTLRMR